MIAATLCMSGRTTRLYDRRKSRAEVRRPYEAESWVNAMCYLSVLPALLMNPAEQAEPKEDAQPLLENQLGGLGGATATAKLEALVVLFACAGTKCHLLALRPNHHA